MKDGDKLIEQLRQAARNRNSIALQLLAILYQPDFIYWMDYMRVNKN